MTTTIRAWRGDTLILGTAEDWAEAAFKWETGARVPADSFEVFAFKMFADADRRKQSWKEPR